MAITVNLYDLENYPENSKTASIDLLKIIPVGYEGDEKFVITCKTGAYSDVANRTAIPDIFIQEPCCGWSKSSGFVGLGGKFTITSSTCKLRVNIDGCTGGTLSGYYEITLDTGTNVTGNVVADDIEAKLRAITLDTTDASHNLAYVNCRCHFSGGKFIIKSGTISDKYTGAGESSVRVYTGVFADSANAPLGFNMPVESEEVSSVAVREVITTTTYSGGSDLAVGDGLGLNTSGGDALYITDGINDDYFTTLSGTTDVLVKVPYLAAHAFDAIANTYTLGAKVQLVKSTDPDAVPTSSLVMIDDIIKWGILSLNNQIDFSG